MSGNLITNQTKGEDMKINSIRLKNYYLPVLLTIFALLAVNASLYGDNRLIFYHGNYGMIDERLELTLDRGVNEFVHDRIPTGLFENTVMLLPEDPDIFLVRTQSFLTETRRFTHLLREHLNREIEVVTKDGSIITGILFYHDHEMIGLQEKERQNSIFIRTTEVRNYLLKPDGLDYQTEPRFVWTISAERAGTYPARLTYLTTGLSWTGLYKAVWNGDYLDLDIMSDLRNDSGIDFENFNISLVAGDPKRIAQPTYRQDLRKMGMGYEAEMMDVAYSAPPSFETAELDEYHVYSYTEPVDLRQGESKQIKLYPSKRIEPEVYYEYITNAKNLLTRIRIVNDEESGLGLPLPQGTIQIYRYSDGDQELNFVGEDRVEQKPVDEEWIISPGVAFDLVGETVVVATRRPVRNIVENDMLVRLRNRSNEEKDILVTHNLRGNWTIMEQNQQHEQISANKIEFRKTLQPGEEYEITWTERIE